MRLLEFKEGSKQSSKIRDYNYEKEFEALLADCKKNKISQSLLLLSKALYLSNLNLNELTKVKSDQKALVEVWNEYLIVEHRSVF